MVNGWCLWMNCARRRAAFQAVALRGPVEGGEMEVRDVEFDGPVSRMVLDLSGAPMKGDDEGDGRPGGNAKAPERNLDLRHAPDGGNETPALMRVPQPPVGSLQQPGCR